MENRLIEINIQDSRYITIDISYGLGGYNFGTGHKEPRGYRVMVKPEEITKDSRSFMAFSGYKHHIHEVQRRSKKAYKEALRKANEEELEMIEKMIVAVALQEKIPEEKADKIVDEAKRLLKEKYEEVSA